MRELLGSLCAVSALVLTSCASAQDVADSSSERSSAVETSGSTTSPTSTTSTPAETSASSATGDATTSDPTTSESPTSTTTQEPQLAARPKVGNCYNTSKPQFRNQRDGSSPVACSRRHTAETFAVFRVSSFPTKRDTNKVWRNCQPRFQRYVGDSATLSKLDVTVILPSIEQTSAGQDWIRCDAIQKANYNTRLGVPRAGSLRGVLAAGVPRAYRGCVKRWPKVDQAVHFTSCNARHQAELIPESLFLGAPDAPFPGVATTESRSKQFCEDVFQTYVPETLNYYYYYPTATSWKSGSHNSTCWALDTRGDGLPPL